MTLKAEREARIAAKAAEKAAAVAAEQARITSNPIYAAIAPQRSAAAEHAASHVESRLREIAAKLVGTDLNVTAPRARSTMNRRDYLSAQAFHSIALQVTVSSREFDIWNTRPRMATGVNEDGIARLVQQARDEAAASFDAYVAKLTAKVGPCDAASVEGSLWNYSHLTVAKGGVREVWKTQQIVNVSVLGNLFNQWPTRKVA